MRRIWLLLAAVLSCLCAVAVAGCGAANLGDSTPAGWRTFQASSVSLSLPDYFEGGEVHSSAEAAGKSEEAEATDPSLAPWEGGLTGVDVSLLMFGEPDPRGRKPLVLAMWEPLPPEASLEEYVQITAPHSVPGGEVRLESLTESEARVVVVCRDVPDGKWSATMYWVAKRSGSRVLSVVYYADSEVFAAMESIFRASAETALVKEP